jgi:putative DNA primase/helicase
MNDRLDIPRFLDRRQRGSAKNESSASESNAPQPPNPSSADNTAPAVPPVHNDNPNAAMPEALDAGSQTTASQPQLSSNGLIDGASLLSELTAAFQRHLALPKGAAEVLAVWVLFTHCFDVAEVSPRLALTSPMPECGKSTVLSILSLLVRKSLLASNVSPALVFRVIESKHPTLLLDEADTYIEGREDFRGILNSGHTRASACVWRTAGENFEPKRFSTWSPIAIAKIGKLPDSLASRSIIIPMRRKRPEEKVERFRPNIDGQPLTALNKKCTQWAADNMARLKYADPQMPAQLSNRAADNWRPLFAIADAIGGEWPNKVRGAALDLAPDEDLTLGQELLDDIRNIFNDRGADRLMSADLCKALNGMDGRAWRDMTNGKGISPTKLAELLRPFGIRPHSIRTGPKNTPKGYEITAFEDAVARYLS